MSTVQQFFVDNPQHRDGVMKAFHAYHVEHFSQHPNAHNYLGALPCSTCYWCGRSRESVRWDDLPAECQKRPVISEVKTVVESEERKAWSLLDKAATEVPILVHKMGMSGETLAVLHHTHGYDPEIVAGVIDVPPRLMADYETAMEVERARSRASQQVQIITAT